MKCCGLLLADTETLDVHWAVSVSAPWFQLLRSARKGANMSTILLIILVLLLLGAFPSWPHSRNWGYAPSGLVGTVLLIFLILLLMGRI